ERQTRYVQGVVSNRSCGFKSHLRHQEYALVAQRIERSPAEAEAVGSSPTQRAIRRKKAAPIGAAFLFVWLRVSGDDAGAGGQPGLQHPVVAAVRRARLVVIADAYSFGHAAEQDNPVRRAVQPGVDRLAGRPLAGRDGLAGADARV